MWHFVSLFLVVNTSAIDSLERLVSVRTYYVLSGMLNPTHSDDDVGGSLSSSFSFIIIN